MKTETIQVKFVNPPKAGKKKGSIKDSNDNIYGAFPNILSQFTAGAAYEVTYSEEDWNGATWKTIKSVKKVADAPAGNGPGPSSSTYRETSSKDAERMWVTAVVRAGIQGGQIQFNDEALTMAVNDARKAWRNTFGKSDAPAQAPKPSASEELNDSIDF